MTDVREIGSEIRYPLDGRDVADIIREHFMFWREELKVLGDGWMLQCNSYPDEDMVALKAVKVWS